jgi:AraC-like DNA-binding protein
MAEAAPPQISCPKLDNSSRPITGIAFLLVTRGDLALRFVDGGCVRLAAGDLLFVPSGARCDLDARRRTAETILLEIPGAWAQRAGALAGRAVAAGIDRIAFAREESEAAHRAGHLLRLLAAHPEPAAAPLALRVVASMVELLALAAELDPSAPKPTRRRATRRDQFLAAVDAARSEPLELLSLASLATRLGVSERQISRLFVDYLEQGFRGWATDLRLERARRLLRETERPVIDVAAETGWRSLSHFNARFKDRTGYAPGVYRSLCQRGEFTTSE